MKPIIKIEQFTNGILSESTLPATNGFSFGAGVDIYSEPGFLKVSQRLDAMEEAASTNDITDAIEWMVKYSFNNKVYGLGQGRIYDYDNTAAGKWSLVHTDSNTCHGQGMIEFNGNLHWASNTNLSKFDGADWTDDFKSFTDNDTGYHPMVIFGDYLCVGDGKYIATLDSAETWTATAVDLPAGYKVRSLAVYGGLLYIGTWRGDNIYDQPEAKMFSCSMAQLLSSEFSEVTVLRECGIHAMTVWKNLLVIFAGVAGNIYIFNGATIQKLTSLPRVNNIAGYWGQIFPGAICEYQGNLLFGFSSTVAEYAGIYMLSQIKLGDPFVLTSSHIMSGADFTNVSIACLFQASTNIFYVSWSIAGSPSTYGVDAINTDYKITSAAYLESQIYSVAPEENAISLKGFEIIAKPLAAVNSILVKYKKDNAASWTTWGTITSANQSMPLWVAIGQAKTIQLRLEFTCTTTCPAIKEIRIY